MTIKRKKPMKQWRPPAKTAAEKAWLAWLHTQPCCVRNAQCGGAIEAQHITSGGRRQGHFVTITLCHYHHHWDSPLPIGECLGKGLKPFIAKHGSQYDMLERQREHWFNEFGTKPWENNDDTV